MKTNYHCYYDSSAGVLLLEGNGDALTALSWPLMGGKAAIPAQGSCEKQEVFVDVCRQLDAYFSGELREFDLPLRPSGTAFQLCVWEQLREIPYGQTITYGEQARRIGNPKAARAVGGANGKNPISIIVPCHRVIGKDGTLTGFGGGLSVKRALLELEASFLHP